MKKIWHQHNLRVHYKQTDQMKVVHHANYVSWFEEGRTEWMRSKGLAYSKMEEIGVLLPVLKVEVNYKKSAVYDELIGIFTRIEEFSPIKVKFYYEARKIGSADEALTPDKEDVELPTGDLLASGTTTHMWINHQWKPTRIDKNFPEIYNLIKEKTTC